MRGSLPRQANSSIVAFDLSCRTHVPKFPIVLIVKVLGPATALFGIESEQQTSENPEQGDMKRGNRAAFGSDGNEGDSDCETGYSLAPSLRHSEGGANSSGLRSEDGVSADSPLDSHQFEKECERFETVYSYEQAGEGTEYSPFVVTLKIQPDSRRFLVYVLRDGQETTDSVPPTQHLTPNDTSNMAYMIIDPITYAFNEFKLAFATMIKGVKDEDLPNICIGLYKKISDADSLLASGFKLQFNFVEKTGECLPPPNNVANSVSDTSDAGSGTSVGTRRTCGTWPPSSRSSVSGMGSNGYGGTHILLAFPHTTVDLLPQMQNTATWIASIEEGQQGSMDNDAWWSISNTIT